MITRLELINMEKKFKKTLTKRKHNFYVIEERFKNQLNDVKLADNYSWQFELRRGA